MKSVNSARIFSILLTGIVLIIFEKHTNLLWNSIYLSVLFCHYLLSFKYGYKNIVETCRNTTGILIFSLLVMSCFFVYFISKASTIILFGLHFALSEMYLRNYLKSEPVSKFNSFDFLFYYFLYSWAFAPSLYIIHKDFIVPENFYISFNLVGLLLFSVKRILSKLKEVKSLFIDFCFLATAILCHLFTIEFKVGVFYHLVLWIFIPIFRFHSNKKFVKSFLSENLIYTIGFFLISPTAIIYLSGRYSLNNIQVARSYFDQAYFWGQIHITLSLIMSKLNPPVINSFLAKSLKEDSFVKFFRKKSI